MGELINCYFAAGVGWSSYSHVNYTETQFHDKMENADRLPHSILWVRDN